MTPSELKQLIEDAQSSDVQDKLSPGFQTGFIASVVSQYEKTNSLSGRQIEVLQDIVERCMPSRKPSKFNARRYEGYNK